MDEDRIIRIARALCRSARMDPDQPVERASCMRTPPALEQSSASAVAWMQFREAAEEFVARHSERVTAAL